LSLTIGESGKPFYIATGVDMSANTELEAVFTKPGGTIVTKTKTGGEVVLGTSPGTFPGVGAVLANEYMIYTIEPLFLDEAAAYDDKNHWMVYGKYTDTVPDPDDVYIGECAAFTVLPTCS
jgi:hypothetical protein